jgi:hypothetical protein
MEEKMDNVYEPDNQFMEKLEWQLASEFRRAGSLRAAGKVALPRRAVILAVSIGVLTTGVTVIKAAEYLKDSWRKKIEIARVRTEVKLTQAHLEASRELAVRAQELRANGLIQEEEFQATRMAVQRAGLDLKKSLLNLEEVEASGTVPRNELSAPEVGGLDFVSQRLEIDRQSLELELKTLEARLIRLRQLVEKNLVPGDELAALQAGIDNRKGMRDAIQKRLDLRQGFIAGRLTGEKVEVQDRLAAAMTNLSQAQSKVNFLRDQLARSRALADKGLVSRTEAGQLRYALEAAQAELRQAALEVDVLRNVN